MKIEDAQATDFDWIERVFKQHGSILGNFYWMKQAVERGHRLQVARPFGFCRWSRNKDGFHVIHEIAVDKEGQRSGVGLALLEAVPLPIWLKTDSDNIKSNSFYKKNGFVMLGKKMSRDGSRTFHIWAKF